MQRMSNAACTETRPRWENVLSLLVPRHPHQRLPPRPLHVQQRLEHMSILDHLLSKLMTIGFDRLAGYIMLRSMMKQHNQFLSAGGYEVLRHQEQCESKEWVHLQLPR